MKLQLSLITFFCICFLQLNAQIFPVKKKSFETLTIDNGLSQGMIRWITQDHLGFMWIATKDGLNRYDGAHFLIYRHDAGDEKSLADNFISCVFEDSKNRLWIGTGSDGLDLFDRATETFIHFRNDAKNKLSISSGNINTISEDKDGVLYASTDNGLNIIHPVKEKNGKESFWFSVIDPNRCNNFSSRKGEIWISPEDDSLYSVNTINNKQVRNNYALATSLYMKFRQDTRKVWSFVHDSVQGYTYMLMTQDMVRYKEKDKTWEHLKGYNFKGTDISMQSVLDNTGFIWFANGLNIYLYDTKLDTTYIVTSDDARQMQMLNSAVTIFKDRSDNIWIGTRGYGIMKYNAGAEKFHHTGSESIVGITENNDGKILIVPQKYYAGLFDKSEGKFIDNIPDTLQQKLLSGNLLHATLQDKSGNYWLSYDYTSLFIYNDTQKKLIKSFTRNPFFFPLYRAIDNKIWFGSPDSLYRYDLNTDKLNSYAFPQKNVYNFYSFVQVIHQQNDSILWVGTTFGVFRFNSKNISWKLYQNNNDDEGSLSSNIIFSLCADPRQPEKYLWVGTNGAGLNRMDITTGKFAHFTTKDGLPNDVVYGILSDEDANLWISTNKGLSRFTPSTNNFLNYEAKDGLQSNEFNRYAYCKTKDGTLFFGGINGFNYFNPRDLGRNNIAPNIVITGFKIGNKPVTIHDEKKLLTKPIELTDKIELNYEDNMISFDFAAMDFTQPEKNLYQYKLEGFDKEWIQSGTVHSATYTNLDPDTYTFRVKGSNSDGVWNETGTSIQLIILPPWYMTWWFRILVAVTIVASAYAFYRYRLQQALKLQSIRNKIASDLHDEIGSNLSSISIFSDVAKEQTEGQPVAPLLDKISNYTLQSMEAMSDIVWMINARNDRFENIIIRMRELAVELLEAKKYSLHLDIDEHLNTLKLGMNERKNFWHIYKEALNNIVKYAEAKNVWIKLSSSHKSILLSIKDDGKGFNTTILKSGNGLHNMRQRSDAIKATLSISSSIGSGTTIDLMIKI